MSVLGLSILIASISFFCYRCPPSSWLILPWLQRLRFVLPSKQPFLDMPTCEVSETQEKDTLEIKKVANESDVLSYSILGPKISEPSAMRQELDRNAMPPPPPVFKSALSYKIEHAPSPRTTPESPPTPRGSNINPTPLSAQPEPRMPSFPALNSAQRASSGTRDVPRLTPSSVAEGGLMPPPQRYPLPLQSRGPPSSSLTPPPTHTSVPTKPRRKVMLTPGHSPLDWARLSSSPNVNLSGLPPGTPYLKVPPSLLKQKTGRNGKDAWTVLGGKVYNITPYTPYHPGGDPELMKAAGRDGTRLFGEVHPWVNWEGMLEGCLVGVAVDEGDVKGQAKLEEMD